MNGGQKRADIKYGLDVGVVLKEDQATGRLTYGKVQKILTNSPTHPHTIRESLCSFLIPLSRSASVLDLGAGTGVMSEFAYACREDLRFTAVDPAEGMLKFSAEYVQTHKANAEALPFDTSSFEAILIGEALHHFQDVEKSLQEIVRVLDDEGRLFIYDFDSSTFMGNTLCRVEKILGEPGNFFAPEVLKQRLERGIKKLQRDSRIV